MDVVEPPMVVKPERRETAAAAEPAAASAVNFKQRLEYLGLRTAVALAHVVPIRALTATGAGIAWTAGPWLRQNRRALSNLAIAFPEKSEAERRRIARAMWANMGRIFAETLVLDRLIADEGCITITDFAHWQTQMALPGPSIACTLHMGNWELGVSPIKRFGREPAGVYKPLDNPLIDRWLAGMRRHLYPGGLLGKGESDDDAQSGHRAARQIMNLARKGHCICFVCDHYDRRGTPIAFMRSEAKFTTAPAMIARHVGARIWVGRILRLGKGSRFRMDIRELEVPKTGDKQADTLAITTAVFATFEAWIREHPEQWMWWNTRWVKPEAAATTGASPQGKAPHRT